MSGIFGVYSTDGNNVSDELYLGTISLQHRGEEGCGISVERNGKVYTNKNKELAYYFFRDRMNGLDGLQYMEPHSAIGHVLYENTGGLQPIKGEKNSKLLSLAMDGVLLGFQKSNELIVSKLFSKHLKEQEEIIFAVRNLMEDLKGKGSYCVVSLVKNDNGTNLVAFRDPKGIKPYCLGKKDNKYAVASESKALDGIEAEFIRDIKPGEVIVISKNGLESKLIVEENHAHCFFEWIYFADPTSVIEGRDVLEVRKELGRRLARKYASRIEVDLVIASPDSGRGVAIGFQQELCKIKNKFIPYEEASVKNPGAKRTFQVEDEEERKLAARVKFYMNKKVVKGKKVAVGDDSIVRGTVFKDGMIYKLNKAGAEKIYPVISCPALLHSCIKDPKGTNFAAYGLKGSVDEIGEQVAKKLNADFVCYPTTEDMREAIGLDDLCEACINGIFPVNEEFWR